MLHISGGFVQGGNAEVHILTLREERTENNLAGPEWVGEVAIEG